MRRTFRILTAAALAICAAAAYADPPGRVARLNYASGAVSLAPGEAPDRWMQAVLNRPLTGGDRLWADRDGRAEFQVGSTAVRMAPLTNIDVLHLDDDRMQLRLSQGSANLRVRVLDSDDLVEVATPAGAVLIRQPGSYRISVDPNSDVTRVAVNFGRADIVTPGPDLTVPSGQAVSVSAHAPAAYEVAAATDEFDRWSADRDRRYDRVASTRYVSPHMTGHEDLDHYGSWRTLPEYGAVWVPARVAPDWAPYRHGHWEWVSPWGWTWIDDAPWGFAPFHYGRWVHVHDYWAWAPGPIVRRPVYAPALVAFVGGPRWSVSVSSGPAVGWFPLGWREPYHPWYRASHRHVHNVNVTHVTNVTNITNVRHVHRHRPEAVTVVPQQSFVSARPVAVSRMRVGRDDLARAEVIRERQPAERVRASPDPERAGRRPPAQAASREVVAVNPATRASGESQRVRVVNREEVEARRAERRERQAERAPVQAQAAPLQQQQPVANPAAPAAAALPRAPQSRAVEREAREQERAQQREQASRRNAADPDERARPGAERRAQGEANQRALARAEQRARIEAEQQQARVQVEQRARVEAEQRSRAEARREAQPRVEPPRQRVESPTPREARIQRQAAPAPAAAAPAPRETRPARPAASAPAAAAPRAQAAQPARDESASRRHRHRERDNSG